MKLRRLLVAVLVVVTFLAVLSTSSRLHAQAHVHYRLVDLGTLGGPNSSEIIQSPIINKQGAVAGYSDTSIPCPGPDCFLFHAFL